jgi:folate-binding protein YgfZ
LGFHSSITAPPYYSSVEAEYWAMRRLAGSYRQGRGVLLLSGAESVDFLQRLSTNDTSPLDAGKYVTSVLTTEKGRIVDVCTILRHEGNILVLTSAGMSAVVKIWLEKYVIMEDITVTDISASLTSISLIGPEVERILGRSAARGWSPLANAPVDLQIEGAACTCLRDDGCVAPYYHLIVKPSSVESLVASLSASGVLRPLGSIAFDGFRIEQGVPLVGKDVDGTVNPLEASLRRYISFSKGCYIGQEVIARIDTYKKLQKELRGMVIDAPQEASFSPGTVWAGEEVVGQTTSHAWSFSLQRHVALGFVRTGTESASLQLRPESPSEAYTVQLSEFPLC